MIFRSGDGFLCDAMMRGLARCLRAAGQDAVWEYGIDDGVLLQKARAEHRTVLTADSGLLKRRTVRQGRPPALYVPNKWPPVAQARLVLRTFHLTVLPSRCLGCGGALQIVPKESVRAEAPPRSFAMVQEFLRCQRCGRLLWKGTHWERIEVLRRCLETP